MFLKVLKREFFVSMAVDGVKLRNADANTKKKG